MIWGRVGWILVVTKTSLTRDAIMELFPTPASPHTHMRTVVEVSTSSVVLRILFGLPVAILPKHNHSRWEVIGVDYAPRKAINSPRSISYIAQRSNSRNICDTTIIDDRR